ncbi:helix-turn-helix domain-containing protein [Streptomyces sp. NPDC019937]|uniref:helix-turn-helix domain-containing protein n=1 Tax=Streptomyces sp. NPDC019937 TaxID=3154787 RepID=UPI003403A6FE
MSAHTNIIDLLNFEGPGLQDFVTPEELDQLLAGTLPHGDIADRYMEQIDFTTLVTSETDALQTRADLLTWIGWELEVAAQQRIEDAPDNTLAALRAHAAAQARHETIALADREALIRRARSNGDTKDAIAKNLGISRPTLDKWLRDQEDRILFNDAIFTLIRRGMPKSDQVMLSDALGIRDTSNQASTLLAALSVHALEELGVQERELVDRAEKRAREVV